MDSRWALTEEWSKDQSNFTLWHLLSDDDEFTKIYITPTDANSEEDTKAPNIGRRQGLGTSPEQADLDDVLKPYKCHEGNFAPVQTCKKLLWEIQPFFSRFSINKRPWRCCNEEKESKCCIGHRIGPPQRARHGPFPSLFEALTKIVYFCTASRRMIGETAGQCRVTVDGIDGTAWVDNGHTPEP
ncbi:hypothetical protein BDP81DRAFT_211956 [Colletotrichum phormii]|uniref:Uncharacterized protein n=1 Tax=Colletotrichum phormii TaxID=359342 RepID=A0AAI9ZSY6_9PEZI|nr:uncharacterized protein BDP81DRAFT_211956 [Colletotrichum phormii]KAK1637640.1 hypothetical protein BDP81DRAFT_211956 [Colletotrichum phormii]